jgi:hypothetical protein
MTLPAFLQTLQRAGRVQIETAALPEGAEREAARPVLRELDARVRLEFPGEAPPLQAEAALWGAVQLYRACQFLVHRETSAALITETLATPCPWPLEAPVTYALDLTFCHLGSVLRLARGLSPEDPLVAGLQDLASRHPYSSVGIPDTAPVEPGPFLEHPGMLQVYTDRILQARDLERLHHPAVRAAADRTLGAHPELCPEAAPDREADP